MTPRQKCPRCGEWMTFTIVDYVVRFVCDCGHAIEYDEEE